jgi:hypothetical protein
MEERVDIGLHRKEEETIKTMTDLVVQLGWTPSPHLSSNLKAMLCEFLGSMLLNWFARVFCVAQGLLSSFLVVNIEICTLSKFLFHRVEISACW